MYQSIDFFINRDQCISDTFLFTCPKIIAVANKCLLCEDGKKKEKKIGGCNMHLKMCKNGYSKHPTEEQ